MCLRSPQQEDSNVDLSTPEASLAAFGGFVYLDGYLNVVGANALVAGSAVVFDGPMPLEVSTLGALRVAQRLQPSRIQGLLQIGVRELGWLRPGEPMGAQDGSAWPDGAFAYVYDEQNTALNCVFRVARNTKVQGNGRGSVAGGAGGGAAPTNNKDKDKDNCIIS